VTSVLAMIRPERASAAAGLFCFAGGIMLFMTSLGLSQRDLRLIFTKPGGISLRFVGRAWQRLGQMSERATMNRREPMLDVPTSPQFSVPPYARAAAPAFGPPPARDYPQARVRRPDLDPAFDVSEPDDDIDPNELERIVGICAPKSSARAAPSGDDRASLLTRQTRSANAEDPIRAAREVMETPGEPAWQAPSPAPAPHRYQEPAHRGSPDYAPERMSPPMTPQEPEGWRPQNLPGGDALYGRAVAIVLGDRKASTSYLEQRLQIGYMRAADLIDRMEREGILGAPVYNGMRPILIGGPGSDEV
jgi:hypothetical protein